MTRHTLITGASAGLGRALSREFAGEGSALTLVARRAVELASLAAELSIPSHCVPCDLASPNWDAGACIHAAEQRLGPIDVLINNAAVHLAGATATTPPDQAEALMRLNLLRPLQLIHAVLPAMLRRGRGTIINISSSAALVPPAGTTWYSAAKAGLAAASEALHAELRGTGVQVLTVYPGVIADTAMGADAFAAYEPSPVFAAQPTITAADLAAAIHRAFTRKRARLIRPRSLAMQWYLPPLFLALYSRLTPRLRGARER